ncbi:HTH-like domain-containing protein [Pseudomonas sp. NFACC24-1]|nr:HTH-like domain-containing protein [Pseudomonas sp. NFACC24-1]
MLFDAHTRSFGALGDVPRSCYYNHHIRRRTPNVERVRLRSRVNELFTQNRSAAGSRSIVSMMQDDGEQIGRFKVRGLARELGLISKQPGSNSYKKRQRWSDLIFRIL